MQKIKQTYQVIKTLHDLAKLASYSLMDKLNSDPDSKANAIDYLPRQVFSGHYVPVNPTPIGISYLYYT